MWHRLLPLLPNIRAVLIDLPGHGGSKDVPWVSLEHTAEQVAQVVDSVVPIDAHLVGISLGSYVGLNLLVKRPNLFRTAFLSGIHSGGMKNQWMMRTMSLFMAPLAVRPFFARKTAAMLGIQPNEVDAYVAAAIKTRPSAFRKGTNDVVAFELPGGLERIRTRTLFVAGSKEHELILASLPILASKLPNSSTMRIPDGGHGWLAAMPDFFVKCLSQLIAEAI